MERTRNQVKLNNISFHVILILGAITMALPFVWMILTSFKPPPEIRSYPPHWIPRTWTLEHFREVFDRSPFLMYFINTGIVSGSVVLLASFFCSLTAYALAKLNLPGEKFILLLILIKIMVPFQAVMVPLYLLASKLRMVDSLIGLIVPTDMISAFGIFMLRQFIIDIPEDLISAARIDGCSEFGIYWRIILPQCTAPLATLAMILFVWSWGNFLWPLIIINSPEKRTLQLGLAMFQSEFWIKYGSLMAATLLSLVPVIAIFIILQRRVIESMTMTGLKG